MCKKKCKYIRNVSLTLEKLKSINVIILTSQSKLILEKKINKNNDIIVYSNVYIMYSYLIFTS